MLFRSFISYVGNGVDATFGPGIVIVPDVSGGDLIIYVLNLTDQTDVTTSFTKAAVSTDQIEQVNGDYSTKNLFFFILRQSI